DLLKTSRDWVGLDADHFRSALSCALELIGAEPLKQLPVVSSQLSAEDRTPMTGNWQLTTNNCFLFPALDQRKSGDPSWASTLDALRTPRRREQSFWDWRRDSTRRPVVFVDPGTMTDEVVHLHLEHRVVQRLLSRFTAQGFVHNDLSRACLAQTADPIPRVLLLGRLCLYGAGAARLHEELIPVTARWSEPDRRKAPLSPYARDAELNTLHLLERALLAPGQPANEVVLQKLRQAAPRDVEELLPHLELRGRELADGATLMLAQRGEKEADAMRGILEQQQKRIRATVEEHRDRTPGLFDQDEMRQLDADRRHWAKRLAEIEAEIHNEPGRIRAVYAVAAWRVEPVGLVYLWPVTG